MSLVSLFKAAQAAAKTSKAFKNTVSAGKVIWTLADTGMDTYTLGDQIARAIMGEDYDPEMRDLCNRATELGTQYDQWVTRIAQAAEVDIPNLSGAIALLHGISADFESTNGTIFDKCESLDALIEMLLTAVPTTYSHLTKSTSGRNRDEDKDTLERTRKLMAPNFVLIAFHAGVLALRGAFKGYSLYKRRQSGGSNSPDVPSRPRRNAMANVFEGMDADQIKRLRSGRVSKFKRLKTGLKTYGKMTAFGFAKVISVGSFGMNIKRLIDERKAVNEAKQALRTMINEFEKAIVDYNYMMNGCKDAAALAAVAKRFELDLAALDDDARKSLEIGYQGVLAEYDTDIDKAVDGIDGTYQDMIEAFEELSFDTAADNQVLQMLRSAYSQSLPLHDVGKNEKDSDQRKNVLDRISMLFSNTVAKQTNQIDQSLNRVIADHQAFNMLKQIAQEIVDEEKEEGSPITETRLRRRAESAKRMIDSLGTERDSLTTVDEVVEALRMLIVELRNQREQPDEPDAFSVTAMVAHQEELYVTANNTLWRRGNLDSGTGNDWRRCGDAFGVTAMTSHQEELYVVSNNKLWQVGSGTGNNWSECGDAFGVTAMTSHQGKLYVVSNNKLWQRGNLGPGTGNDWSDCGDGYGITAMTTYQGKLYVVSNNKLWRRGNLGPGTGNDWSDCGTFTVPASTAQPKPLYAVSRP
jgi:hypothetical protein